MCKFSEFEYRNLANGNRAMSGNALTTIEISKLYPQKRFSERFDTQQGYISCEDKAKSCCLSVRSLSLITPCAVGMHHSLLHIACMAITTMIRRCRDCAPAKLHFTSHGKHSDAALAIHQSTCVLNVNLDKAVMRFSSADIPSCQSDTHSLQE
jgi:hypothetical protein